MPAKGWPAASAFLRFMNASCSAEKPPAAAGAAAALGAAAAGAAALEGAPWVLAAAGGFSAEQLAFMNRKKAEAAGQPFAGYGSGAANTHGAPSGAAAPAAAAPKAAAAPAPAGGFSAEQIAFMNSKKAEASGQPFAGYGSGAANTH